MSAYVVGNVTDVRQKVDQETGEIKSGGLIIGGIRRGQYLFVDADMVASLPDVGQRVIVTVVRESWDTGSKRDDGRSEYASINKVSDWRPCPPGI